MSKPLTTAAGIGCGHGGAVQLAPLGAKLNAEANEVLTDAHLVGALILGCAQIGPGLTPCASVVSVTAGHAAKLKSGSAAALLDTLAGTTSGAPSNNLLAAGAPGQIKLNAG